MDEIQAESFLSLLIQDINLTLKFILFQFPPNWSQTLLLSRCSVDIPYSGIMKFELTFVHYKYVYLFLLGIN